MWTWKNWLGVAGVVAGSVLLSFIVQWHITTGWRVFWLDGLIRWWGDFVMFGWARDYQTLLAGFFALFGGGFVLMAAIYQRHIAEMDAMTTRRQRLQEHLALAAIEYRRLLRQVRRGELEDALATTRSCEATALGFALTAAPLANWLIRVNELIESNVIGAIAHPEASKRSTRKRGQAYALLAVEYLSLTARLVMQDGAFKHVPVSREQVESRLQNQTGFGLNDLSYSDFVVAVA